MIEKIRSLTLIILFLMLRGNWECFAYDNINTHQNINENAALQSEKMYSALKSLGFYGSSAKDLLENPVNGQPIKYWFREGGRFEDETPCRSRNHFHDPLKFWDNAGLNNAILDEICSNMGESMVVDASIIWAQRQAVNLYSWPNARNYYYNALISKDSETIGQNLALTLRAVGQVMHLLADSSVPEHVRNDIHVFPLDSDTEYIGPYLNQLGITLGTPTYETWTKNHYKYLIYTGIKISPLIFNKAIPNSAAPVPITALWDQDKYQKSMPSEWVPYSGLMVGLAEYTNANFFSKDTTLNMTLLFEGYPHPSLSETNFLDIKLSDLETMDAEDGKIDKRIYISKMIGDPIKHLAAISYFHMDLLNLNIYKNTSFRLFFLDDKCFEEYASHLVPMAVGYDTALLDYFFRGTIEITPPDQYVYSIMDGSRSPQQFTKIKVNLKNTTPNELMQSGTLTAVAKYKKRTDYKSDLSGDPPGVNSMASDFSYSVSATRGLLDEELVSLNVNPTEFTFDFTQDPIPAGITDLSLQIVFKGTLGNEKDNAIAIGYKDLMEPTHLVFWNLTDRFSLYISADSQYHLYTEAQIVDNTNLFDLVDFNHNEILNEANEPYISQYDITYDIAFMGSSSAAASAASSAHVTLHPGNYTRLIVLADNPTNASQRSVNYLKLTSTDARDGASDSIMSFSGAYNQDTVKQDTGEVIFNYTDIETFRTIRQHFSTGILRCYPMAYNSEGKPTCPYNESEVMTPSGLAPTPAGITFE